MSCKADQNNCEPSVFCLFYLSYWITPCLWEIVITDCHFFCEKPSLYRQACQENLFLIFFSFEANQSRAMSCKTDQHDSELTNHSVFCLFYLVGISSRIFLCLRELAIRDFHFFARNHHYIGKHVRKSFLVVFIFKSNPKQGIVL